MKPDLYYIQRCEILGTEAAAKGDAPVGVIPALRKRITSAVGKNGHQTVIIPLALNK